MSAGGDGPGDGEARDAEPIAATDWFTDPVARADLRRSRQAVFGTGAHPEAARFASSLARAVAENPVPAEVAEAAEAAQRQAAIPAQAAVRGAFSETAAGDAAFTEAVTDPGPAVRPPVRRIERTGPGIPRVHPALRDAAFGAPPPAPPARPVPAGGAELVALPNVPALVCDRAERVVRVNAALLRLAGRGPGDAATAEGGPVGLRLAQLVVGPDVDARLVRADGELVRVRVVRWDVPERQLLAVALVELGEGDAGRAPERRRLAELERMAHVGTWTFDLASARLARSESLQEIYRSAGVDPESGPGPLEGEQVALLCQALRSGRGSHDSHVEIRLPGGRLLSCRAEVEHATDGTPVRLVGVVHDIAAQRRAESRVQNSGHRFADLMELTPAGVALLDATGRVVDANAALCALLGLPLERLRGVPAAALAVDAADGRPDWLREVPPGAAHGYRVERALRRGDDTSVWCEVAVAATTADDGAALWLLVVTDVGERRRAAELLRSAGIVDELTRLPNRAATLELLDRLLAGPGRDRVAVVCGDLDDFQRVNSSLGHEAGDDLLVAVAARLQRELPVGCTAARLAGDEFVVVCADHGEAGGPDALARAVADLLRATVPVHGRPVQLTASVGVAAAVPGGEVRPADLLRFAEVAMHDAKRRQDRGGIAVATDGVVTSATQALELEAQLRAAIAEDALTLVFQPVVGPNGTVRSAEALVRWPHPDRGLIPPADFLPVAQRSGLLRDLDRWVLRTAVREAAGWPGGAAVAVNLAGLLPGDPEFLAEVTAAVRDSGLGWHRLVLELVETSLVALPPHALAAMDELVERGVRFAVDDFGTGYSSLARLKELPAQIVKLDRAFVRGVGEDPADFAVARAVVDIARAMGRRTVAEGVETAGQFHVLRGIGVDGYQGYLFARPLPVDELRAVLAGERLPTPASQPDPPA